MLIHTAGAVCACGASKLITGTAEDPAAALQQLNDSVREQRARVARGLGGDAADAPYAGLGKALDPQSAVNACASCGMCGPELSVHGVAETVRRKLSTLCPLRFDSRNPQDNARLAAIDSANQTVDPVTGIAHGCVYSFTAMWPARTIRRSPA
jgi:hypothetical protein